MDKFPVLPDSVMVSRDGKDVFLSFHWGKENIPDARFFSLMLTVWVVKALRDMDAKEVSVVDGGLSE